MRLAAMLFALIIMGCGHQAPPEPRIVTQRVEVPISTPCAVDAGPDPAPLWTRERIDAAPSLFSLGMLLWAAYAQEAARNLELKAAVEACKR